MWSNSQFAIRNCMNFTPPAPYSQAGYFKHLILFQGTFLSSGIKRFCHPLRYGKIPYLSSFTSEVR